MGTDTPENKQPIPVVDCDTDKVKDQADGIVPDVPPDTDKDPIEKVEYLEHALDELEAMIKDLDPNVMDQTKEKS
jgi:hypothetical protein